MQKSDSKIKFTNYEEVEIPETLKTTLGLFLFKNFLISLGLFIILFGIIFIIFSTMQFFELWAILTTIFSTMFIGIIFYILSSIKGFKDLKRKTVYLIKGTAEKISNDKNGTRIIFTSLDQNLVLSMYIENDDVYKYLNKEIDLLVYPNTFISEIKK